MQANKRMLAGAAGALLIAAGSLPASAQYGANCGDIYNQTMSVYQSYGPQSPQYAEILNFYNTQCLGGPPVSPGYPYVQPVDPGAAIVGGIIGGVVGGALSDHRRHDRDFRRDRREHRDHWRR